MKYTEEQVIDIIKTITKESPDDILKNWKDKESNTLLDLSHRKCSNFVYSFPVIVGGVEVGMATLVQFAYTGYDNYQVDFMRKYLGNDNYEVSEQSYVNNNTYLNCYFTFIADQVELPEKVEGFHAYESSFFDVNNQEVMYRISYGCPSNENDRTHTEYRYDTPQYNSYILLNDMVIQIEKKEIEGYSLGERINENIKQRLDKNENN